MHPFSQPSAHDLLAQRCGASANADLIGTAASADTLSNLRYNSAADAGLINAATFDYHLTSTSPVRAKAVDPEVATSTVPNYQELPHEGILEYVHPCQDRI